MARPKKRFAQLIEEIDRTPWGLHEQNLVAEAVALATEIGDDQLEYQARMRQTASANMGGLTDLMLNSFAWCLARHDADPSRFPADIENGAADLLWQFKWMASSLRSSPAFAPEQIAAVLDDMETHYRTAGLGMSGVLMARFEDAHAAGRLDEAEELRVRIEATPRDSHSHCDACGRSQIAGFFAETGRETDTIRLVEEMIEGGFSCGEEPEHALSVSLVPYLHQGRGEEAKSAHLRSYRLSKDNPDMLGTIARSIVFCAITGNEARALSLVERHIGWLAHDRLNVQAHFSMLAAIGTTLDRVAAVGHGGTPVRGADAPELVPFFGEHEGAWTAAELATAAWAAAERIGRSFDVRDGSDSHARRLKDARALAEERFDVPIRTDVLPAPAPDMAPTDVDGWYRRIVDLAGFGTAPETMEAMPHAIDAVDPQRRAILTGQRLAALVNLDRVDEATALLPDRLRTLRAAGHDEQAALEERFGLAMFGGADDDDLEALAEAYAGSAGATPVVRGDLALTLASHWIDDDPDAALDLAEHAARHFEDAGDRRMSYGAVFAAIGALLGKDDDEAVLVQTERLLADPEAGAGVRARALEIRARVHGVRDEFAEGAAEADEACRILAELGGRRSLARTHLLAGALWEEAGEPEQALTRYRVTARLAEQEGGDLAGAKYRVGRVLLAADAAAEAAEVFGDVLKLEEAAEASAETRAMTVSMLARALRASEEYGQAYGAFGYAAELFGEAEDPADQSMSMLEQARLLGQFGEQDDAVETLEAAAEIVRTAPDALGAMIEVLHNLGQAYGAKQDERAFPLFDEVERLATENEAAWLIADVADSRARAYAAMDRVDEAVAAALTASDGYAAAGDAQSAGSAALLAARSLAGSGRDDDAVAAYRAVLENATEIPPLRQIAALELGDVLERQGRTAEAAAARAIAED
ncbi:tetratricopeptide (TPR) repeat protein [Microbacterium resistens]|uniref:Tetratricopeptide (TPR) repeat protein n=1 Tax=Microbacterium resistens TaxID=156977 RepID=A0ABU1SFN1_9MICO|nr:hypothetical protein [Microbacterium resistens]MDR6868098.1 tetratricopeptide (TPR) repeat protein [Microbacterium resistens]